MTKIIAYFSAFEPIDDWQRHLAPLLPEMQLCSADQITAPDCVTCAMVWDPPLGFFARFPNLRLIVNLGAGVDKLMAREDLPPQVPVVRLADPGMTQMMTSFALFAVLRHARDIPSFEALQSQRVWDQRVPRHAFDIPVAVLGLGELGGAVATELARHGFQTLGWASRPKSLPGVDVHHGHDALLPLLARAEIIVSLLPMTPATDRILDANCFAAMPKRAAFVNLSRGGVVDEPALIAALQSGHLSGATLDVFATEPLPADNPLWSLPGVLVTPHVAAAASPRTSASQVAANIRASATGAELQNLVSPQRGY